jgi:hydroxymethylpyrimidine/phosphomethylpyrimidine kinase
MVCIALTIAGSDSGGGAGIQADLKTFMAHRVHGLSIITSLTAQNTREVRDVFNVPTDFIESQFEAVHRDFQVGAAKTGMLSEEKIIKAVSKKIGDYPLVVDPVMVSESGGRLLETSAVETLKEELIPKAVLVTPNIFEAEILADMKINSLEDMKKATRKISRLGCSTVVKGGHLNAVDVLHMDNKIYTFEGAKLKGEFHGSGCVYSSSISANLALGFDLVTSVSNAKHFMSGVLESAYSPGKGDLKAVNPLRIGFEVEVDDVLLTLRRAVLQLESLQGLHRLSPEVGMNICFARVGATQVEDVAGVSGRIVKTGNQIRGVGSLGYGYSNHVARVVLSVMAKNGAARSAMNIKYSPELIKKIAGVLDFKIAFFERKDEPEGLSTMEWGTKNAIEKLGFLPDLIYDRGGLGKEPMIRIIGKNPIDVVSKLKSILEVFDEP